MHREILTGAFLGEELLSIDRPAWAWEFLRRNSAYSALSPHRLNKRKIGSGSLSVIEARECGSDQRQWGLLCVEDPALDYMEGNVFWRADVDPRIIAVTAQTAQKPHHDDDTIDFANLPAEVAVLKIGDNEEHVLIKVGTRALQLTIRDGSILHGPVRLSFHINSFEKAPLKLLTLRRLVALQRLRRFPLSLFPRDKRAKRWLLELRALDLQLAGKSREEMAQALFGESLSAPQSDWLLSRLRRVLSAARHIADVGYLDILAGGNAKVRKNSLPWVPTGEILTRMRV